MGESEVFRQMDNREDRNEWAVSKGPKGIGVFGSLKPWVSLSKADPYNTIHFRGGVPIKTTDLVKLECRKLRHPTCDLLENSFPLEV